MKFYIINSIVCSIIAILCWDYFEPMIGQCLTLVVIFIAYGLLIVVYKLIFDFFEYIKFFYYLYTIKKIKQDGTSNRKEITK